MNNYYAYMRISTKLEREKQTFNRQETALKKFETDNNIEFVLSFKDDASGKDFNRPQWKKLESIITSGDTIVFKDISRFTRESENGYKKYMELLDKGINLVFLDNATVSTDYIKQLMSVAKEQSLVARTSLENTIKLLLIVELDRVEQERLVFIKRIKDGLAASDKKSGRKFGQVDKLTPELRADIKRYLKDRTIKQADILKNYEISRTTLSKYIDLIKKEQ